MILAAVLAATAWAPPSLRTQPSLVVRPPASDLAPLHTRLATPRGPKHPVVGLVLSGGGARGLAQIGVLRVLEERGVPVDVIAATSLGAVVGGLYAAGYTPAELESIAVTTDWDQVLSLTEEAQRRDLVVDKKVASDRSFLAIRFEGLQPVLPPAVSSGQRFTNYLSELALQAPRHPNPSFDDLRFRFRAVSTDLVSGRRVVASEGSLAEALRASATVPLLFSPIERDSMRLVDGGLVSNIPVDLAVAEGCNLVVAVNSTSGLRNAEELDAPWQTADQIMGIMMQAGNLEQLARADVVITPDVGRKLASDFTGIDSLVAAGERAAAAVVDDILRRYDEEHRRLLGGHDTVFANPAVVCEGFLDDTVRLRLLADNGAPSITLEQIRWNVCMLQHEGIYRDVRAEVTPVAGGTRVVYVVERNPAVAGIELRGCRVIPAAEVERAFVRLVGRPLSAAAAESAADEAVRLYRRNGYSLARVDTMWFDEPSGRLTAVFSEGVLRRVGVEGGVRTTDDFLLSEFPLGPGDVFAIERARRGVANVNGTTLFEFVYLEISYEANEPVLTIRVRERPSQLIRLGVRADNERNLQGMIDLRDENFQGAGMEIGLSVMGGPRNWRAAADYKAYRLFETGLSFSAELYTGAIDTYVFEDAPDQPADRWDRIVAGEYRELKQGGRLAFGAQLERLGNVSLELVRQNNRIRNIENATELEEFTQLALLRLGTVIDSKDAYPFPLAGVGLNLQFEFSFQGLGGDVSYNAVRFLYEFYTTWGKRHTVHPRITLGFADRTMPLSEQFRLGGRESMFGTREDDRRGRQLLAFNLGYRYKLPVRLFFDSYVGLRYDLAAISDVPEQIKLANFRHGLGAELGLDTPVGPAYFGVGKSFYFSKDLPEYPLQEGPFLFYFRIGYEL